MLRLWVESPLAAGVELLLPRGAARHAQVRRLQPGDAVVLFDGRGGEWQACVTRMARDAVQARAERFVEVERELPLAVTLAVGMPANERMDILVEKATELGVAALQPLLCERSVLRVSGERADRKCEHWRALATAASEQCGGTRVPRVETVVPMRTWLAGLRGTQPRWLLSPAAGAPRPTRPPGTALLVLSGPEGGFTAEEVEAAQRAGFAPYSLGPRVLRAETAPLAVMAWLAIGQAEGR